ncbi:hypothetical protein BH09ACT5_BH09ACT5_01610 [soil metagenome]
MTFLPITRYDDLGPEGRAASESTLGARGGSTNLEATLLSSLPSFTAYAQVHALADALAPYIGERAVSLFSYAISDENDCLVSAAFYRRILRDNGEDPDNPQVTEAEQLLIDWGRLIVSRPSAIPEDFYARLEAAFNPQLRVLLLAYAGQVVATNLFATVGRVPLDESLLGYRRPGDERTF